VWLKWYSTCLTSRRYCSATKKKRKEKTERKRDWMWWHMPIIPATWEVGKGGSLSEAGLGKKLEALSEK
jgi:hypothetical protein